MRESGSMCWVVPFTSGDAMITWVSFGRRALMKIRISGNEQTNETTVRLPSPSINPNNAKIIVFIITYRSKTIPSILHIALQGDDLDANASPFGGGVRGAIMGCIVVLKGIH